MRTAFSATFRNFVQAEAVVDELRSRGFLNNDVSVVIPDDRGSHQFLNMTATRGPEGTALGVSVGGMAVRVRTAQESSAARNIFARTNARPFAGTIWPAARVVPKQKGKP